jgi:hypothetical protein
MSMSGARTFSSVTIPAGGSLSSVVDLSGASLAGIILPSNWIPAPITFRVGMSLTGLANLVSTAGTEISYTVAPGQAFLVNPWDWAGAGFLQIRSGPSASPVTQTNAVTVYLILWG